MTPQGACENSSLSSSNDDQDNPAHTKILVSSKACGPCPRMVPEPSGEIPIEW